MKYTYTREDLTDWLIKSEPLLDDKIDRQRLERMTGDELLQLVWERQCLIQVIAQDISEGLEELSRCKDDVMALRAQNPGMTIGDAMRKLGCWMPRTTH